MTPRRVRLAVLLFVALFEAAVALPPVRPAKSLVAVHAEATNDTVPIVAGDVANTVQQGEGAMQTTNDMSIRKAKHID